MTAIRDLAKYGIITDVDPYNLPPSAFSFGKNVRFKNNSILRAPVFRTASASMSYSSPRFVSSNSPLTGFDSVILGYLNGRVTSFKSNTETDLSISGYSNNDAEAPFTTCHLGDVFYVNRSDRVPWSLKTTDTQFHTLLNWDTTWRANILRACGSALVAFGITKAGTTYPTMVKTSEFAQVDTVPSTWDATVTTNNATENILAEMEGPIVDAQNLGNNMIIYGRNETWLMIADGSKNVWAYTKLFTGRGAINANCSVEVNKKHFVFGLDDIWVHDGNSDKSIANGRVREFIFNSINVKNAARCYVAHNQAQTEIEFNFVSGDAHTAFIGGTGCNRAAVYNYAEDTWTFDDRPFTFGATRANLDTTLTYATAGSLTYDTAGGTYLDQDDSIKKVFVVVGDASATYGLSQSIYAFDPQGPGSQVSLPVDTNATVGWRLERDGIDLDELGADLRGYKLISSIIPQGRLETDADPIEFSFGSADYFNENVVMSDPQTYDGAELYKLDYSASGRYLYMLVQHDDWHYVKLTAFDIEFDVTGER